MYYRVLELTPTSIDAHYHLAVLFVQAGECRKARTHYTYLKQQNIDLNENFIHIINSCKNSF
jgi:hypothetical protein